MLAERNWAINNIEVDRDGQLSLLMWEQVDPVDTGEATFASTCIEFVSWFHTQTRMGQRAELDKDNCVKWSVPSRLPVMPYRYAQVVHPIVGVRMLNSPGSATRDAAAYY